ncbi:MAG: outer membrane beta-barrel protein [Candidatus Latescibacterota bacterium]|jgi:hypothetical protein
MKRTFILLSGLILLIAAPTLSAQEGEKGNEYAFSIGIGTGIPVDPNEFESNNDPSFGGVFDFEVARWFLAVSASLDYNFFLSNDLEPNDINIVTGFLNFKLKPGSGGGVRPYVFVGGGYLRYWVVDLNLDETTTGWQFGGGVEIDISKTQGLFIDGKYVEGRTRDTNVNEANTVYIPIRVGLSFMF